MLTLVLLISCAYTVNANSQPQTIQVASYLAVGNGQQVLTDLFAQFEQKNQQQADVTTRFFYGDPIAALDKFTSSNVKPNFVQWLSGSHLNNAAQRNQIVDMSALWTKYDWQNSVSSSVYDAVSVENKPYAVPVSFYPWAIYFRRSLVEKYQIQLPTNWQQLLTACQVAADNEVHLFAVAGKQQWPLLAWFDYINLRLNGRDTYQKLLNNNKAWTGPEITAVLEHLKALRTNNCFNDDSFQQLNIEEVYPLLFREHAVMSLTGGYILGFVPAHLKHDFDVIPFPVIGSNEDHTTIAPVETFVALNSTKFSPEEEKFMTYLTSEEFQTQLINIGSRIPVNLAAQQKLTDPIQQSIVEFVSKGDTVQFFDRESSPELAEKVAAIIFEFMSTLDIYATQQQLQRAVDSHYSGQLKPLGQVATLR